MAVISKGIKLYHGMEPTELTNLMEVPDLGGETEAIEITVLSDAAHKFTDGLISYGDSLAFKFLYDKTQFTTLSKIAESENWKVELPDGSSCSFTGTCSVKLDGVGINSALTYTLSIKPDSEMKWA